MDVNKVIELGKISMWDSFAHVHWAWYAALIAAVLWMIWGIIHETTGRDGSVGGGFGVFMLIISFFGIIISQDAAEKQLIEKWKTDVAYPYIESLPLDQGEVVFIKIETALSTSNYYRYYLRPLMVKLTPMTISFKGSGVETYTNWYEANMKLTDNELPFVKYRRLSYDLGHDVIAGLYDVEVNLPKSYKFTDIK